MLLNGIIFFLALSIVFYVLFGGADFGAGMLEIITQKGSHKRIANAISPVWEANHVWLILVIVILFMGFPGIYASLSLYLHIPIVLLLVGIIFRGTAFVFRHYDVIVDRSSAVYNGLFKLSSLLTPLFLGIIIGAVMMGRINPEATTFYEAFVYPWFNLFSASIGVFCICLFTFLAAVFMIGEAKTDAEKEDFIRASKLGQFATVGSGILVFVTASSDGFPLVHRFFTSWISVVSMGIATLMIPALHYFLGVGRGLMARVLAGAQILLVLVSWFWIQHPVVVNLKNSTNLTFYNTAAPDATLVQLGLALLVGSLLILPSLFFLMRVFKSNRYAPQEDSK